MAKIVVTGGAGYIGSHTIVDLVDTGFEVISIDNFINSEPKIYSHIQAIIGRPVQSYNVDLCDLPSLERVFADNEISAIIHFAALKSVGDSVADPLLYYHNNLEGLINVLRLQEKYGVKNLIFSSSCSVYGNAEVLPVTESTPISEAESPYARTKQIGEQVIEDFLKTASDHQAVLLRYFNPAGAHTSGHMGESPHNLANNLVPIITETAIGKRKQLSVFGDDYPTRDGTCIRDYIHIMDLARAHTLALQYLLDGKSEEPATIINLGSGVGSTVLEVIHSFEKTSGEKLNYQIASRREGDVVAVYADYSKAESLLGWKPERTLDEIMSSAWTWEKKRSQ